MRIVLKNIFLTICIAALCSCCDTNSYIISNDYVDIISVAISSNNVALGDSNNIYLKANAPNKCWTNIKFFIENENNTNGINKFNVTFKAKGDFKMYNNNCQEIAVYSDTSFYYKYNNKGKYFLYALTNSGKILKDSVVVY